MVAANQNLRERAIKYLSGDAKPGSVRAHLANGVVDIVDMTPLGAVFDASDLSDALHKHDMGKAALAGGMLALAVAVPGPEGKGAGKVLRFMTTRIDRRELSGGAWTTLVTLDKHVDEVKKALRDAGMDVEHGGLLPKGRARLFVRGSINQLRHAGKPQEAMLHAINRMSNRQLRQEMDSARGIWRKHVQKEILRRKNEPH